MQKALKSVLAFLLVAATPLVAAGVAFGTLLFLPLPATLPAAKPTLERRITHYLDSNGAEIATIRQFETSIPFAQTDVPEVLKQAVVAAEDQDFYGHSGVDLRAIVRALWADIRNKSLVEGGSTITQQYVKQAFTGGDRTFVRKIREAILAAQLDRQLDKDTILYKYLSISYFGGGAYGVGAAAQTFFRKPVNQLTLSESAVLASVLPAPTAYEPRAHPDVAEQRRVSVLNKMLQQGRIDSVTHAAAVAESIWLLANGDPPGPATIVYPPEEQQSIEPWFSVYVTNWLKAHLPGCDGTTCELYDKGGLTVITTLDPRMQAAAKDQLLNVMGDNEPSLNMAITSVEPATGFIKAMVGGRDFTNQVNMATSGFQPGSAFKPFVLAAALEQGIQPTKTYSGSPCQTPDGGVIQNYGGASYGTMDLRRGTWQSVNGVYCRLIQDVGVEQTLEMTRRLGVMHTPPFDPVNHGLSVTLGVTNASTLDMASAYGVFANHGMRVAPTPVLQVLDVDGKVILDNTNAAATAQPVLPAVVADNVTDILRGVITDGTARGKGLDRPAAGKTGTAEEYVNAWFVGYTPTLSTAVWIGHPDCQDPTKPECRLRGINGVGQVTGGSIPAQAWQRYMKQALDGVPVTEFAEPAPIKDYAEEVKQAAKGGFDTGARKYPTKMPGGGPYVEDPTPPTAVEPTTTTTSTTTSTTRPILPTTTTNPLSIN